MKIIQCVQYTPEWWLARRGIPTASNFDRIITSTGKLSTQADDYIAELIADQVQLAPPFFTAREGHTPAMRNGIALEPEARRWLAMDTEEPVVEAGFVTTDDGRFGCSPDAFVGADGIAEIKCPELKNHASYVLKGGLPPKYRVQVHGQLAVCRKGDSPRTKNYWLSYSPGIDPLKVLVEPDEFTDKIDAALESFWVLYQEALDKVARRDGMNIKADVVGEAKIAAVVQSWQKRMDQCDDPAPNLAIMNVNGALPELALIPPWAKRACWDLTLRLMKDMGCVWDAARKAFVKGSQ